MNIKPTLVINYINLFAALFMAASLILWVPMQRPALYLFFISYIVEIFTDKKWVNMHFDKRSVLIAAMFLFFMLSFLYIPFEDSSNYFAKVIERRIAIFAFALIAFLGVNKLYKLSYFLNTFILTSVAAVLYLVFYRVGIDVLLYNPDRFNFFNQARVDWVSTHMIFNFYLNMSLIACWYILTRMWRKLVWWHRYLYITAMSVIFLALSISEGRSGFIMSILLMLGFLFFEIWKRRKVIGIVIALLIPFVVIGLASQKDRISERMLRSEPRLFLWKSAYEVVKTSPFVGNGISDAQNSFDISRAKNQTEEFRVNNIKTKLLDAHNQYLQTSMEFGIVGLLLLLFVYIYPIFIVDKDRQLMTVLIIVTCMFQSMFDVFITNTFSVFFGLLMLLMLFVPNDISARKKHSESEVVG